MGVGEGPSVRAMRETQREVIKAAHRPGPFCRDCADEDGVCPSGHHNLCDPYEDALDTLRIVAKSDDIWRLVAAAKRKRYEARPPR